MADQAGPPAAHEVSAEQARQGAAPPAAAPATPVRDGIGLGLAVGVSGLAYGAAAVGSGLSTGQACVLSLLFQAAARWFAVLSGAVPPRPETAPTTAQ